MWAQSLSHCGEVLVTTIKTHLLPLLEYVQCGLELSCVRVELNVLLLPYEHRAQSIVEIEMDENVYIHYFVTVFEHSCAHLDLADLRHSGRQLRVELLELCGCRREHHLAVILFLVHQT